MKTKSELKKLTVAALRKELSDFFAKVYVDIAYAADVFDALQQRGEDTTMYGEHWINALSKIASGQLSPELAIQVIGNKGLIDLLASLPIKEQSELAKINKIQVFVPSASGNGRVATRSIQELSRKEARTVFHGGTVQPPSKQKALIEKAATKTTAKPSRSRPKRAIPGWASLRISDILTALQCTDVDAWAERNGITPQMAIVNALNKYLKVRDTPVNSVQRNTISRDMPCTM